MRACDYSVYRIRYSTTFAERKQSAPGEDFDLTGRHVTEERNYLVVAPTEAFATIAWMRYHSQDRLISCEHIGTLDDLVYLQ